MAQKAPSLESQVRSYWDSRVANGADGLRLLDKCITRFAQHRDWDALARFVVAAHGNEGTKAKVVKIIRAAFGNSVVFKLDKKHSAGGVFTMVGWPEGSFNLSGSNTYGAVRAAVKAGVSWSDKTFLTELSKTLPDVPKKDKTVDDAAAKKVVKHLAAYVLARKAEGFNIGDIVAAVQKELASAQQVVVEKKTVNGGIVYEPNF